jgi:hypothetical protein
MSHVAKTSQHSSADGEQVVRAGIRLAGWYSATALDGTVLGEIMDMT